MSVRARSLIFWLALLGGCGDEGEGSGASSRSQPPTKPPPDSSNAVFDDETFAAFELTMDPADWQSIVDDPHNDAWRRASMRWQGETVEDVGVRASGVTTRRPGDPKPSLRLDFDAFVAGREWRTFEQIRLDGFFRDETFLRDRLSYWVHRSAGLVAPRAAHATLVVNGTPKGVYGLEETVRKELVKRAWGENDGLFYEARHVQSSEPDPYRWQGPDPGLYVPFPFEPKTDETVAGDPGRVVLLLDLLNNSPLSERRDLLDARILDVDRFLRYLAALQMLADYDGITASWGSNNHYWYVPTATGRFVIIPWDPEFSLGLFGMSPSRSLFEGMDRTAAARWVAQDPASRALFLERARDLLDRVFPALEGKIDHHFAQIRDAVHADPHVRHGLAAFDAGPARLKDWIRQRMDYVRTQLP